MLPVMESAIRDWQPNVILHETCEYASAVAGVRLGVPVGQVALSPAEVEWGSIKVASLALNEHLDGVTDALRMSPYLTRFPATLDPSPFPRTWRYREPIAPRRGALPAWWGPCAAGPLVYVSFGTIVVQMPFAEDLYRAVIEAVDGLPARVLMTTGRGFDVSRLREVPGNVHVEAWIEQLADVLGEAELVVCHGGPGTVYGALAAGVPLVAVPLFADQFANSHTVVQAGTGIQVLPEGGYPGLRDLASRLDASRIRAAIQTVLADRSFRESAASVSAEMAAASTVGDVLARLVASARPAQGSGVFRTYPVLCSMRWWDGICAGCRNGHAT
jgi:hypothetical protein